MIVICKNCDTKYDIKDEVIPEQGAQLKCAKCEKMIFVTKESNSENKEPELKEDGNEVTTPFSDFDERPTILAPESFHDDYNLNKSEEELDPESSSKSGISPNFLSKNHESGPSFEEVFDDFEEELSNEDNKKTKQEAKQDTKNENSEKLESNTVKKPKKENFDDALDDFFDDLTKQPNDSDKKETGTADKKESVDVEIEEVGVDVEIEEVKADSEEEKTIDLTSSTSPSDGDDDSALKHDDGETQEISNMQMEELKEKLKDGLNDSDFVEGRNNLGINDEQDKNSKIFVKLEDGPIFEFQIEKDMIQWLKAKSSLNGVLYSLDNIEFSPILNHQIFKDVEEIIRKAKDEEVDVVSASDILERKDISKKANLMPVVSLLGLLIVLLIVYILHLSDTMHLSFLDSITPKSKVIIEKHTEIEEETTKVKIKKINKQEKGHSSNATEVTDVALQHRPENKEEKKIEDNKEIKKEEKIEEKIEEKKEEEVYKILPKEKRAYYKKARLAVKAKKVAEAKKRYLTIAYNYPKEAEAYGVLYGLLKKDKDTKKHASKFIKAYKALNAKKANKTVTKELIKELLK